MAGHIVKRSDRVWLVRIPRGRDSAGKRLFHSKTVRGTKKDAQRYLTLKQRELDTGTFVEPTAQTLEVFLRQWLTNSAKTRVRPRTLADYESLAERYILPRLGHRKLAHISAVEIQAVYADMQQRGL